ncbi:MAG: pyruvate kinase [Candidatus Bathyarchaeota archaeon]|nr:pyruvate kinase [Candidatus Bathyarchaeota archaeon]
MRDMSHIQFTRSKIVCTIGPASQEPEILKAMVAEGMDVARINMSHGEPDEYKKVFNDIREIGDTSILIDLPGPKIRLGELDGKYMLKEGDMINFTTEPVIGNKQKISVSYSKLPSEIMVGGHLFINDGVIDLEVTEIDNELKGFTVKVVSGGEISSRKGVNAPGANLSLRPPTEKDMTGIKFGVQMDCDWFAASFVRTADDVEAVRLEIEKLGGDQPIISKIEHGEAVHNIKEIIEASDGIMVARGDLGIEIPPWDVPLLQKKIIEACNKLGKPVIVATQMLESMMQNPRPTRAEASDVANALLDGADAVMLSGETAVGKFPVETVRIMNSIGWVVQEQITHKEEADIKTTRVVDLIGSLAARAVIAVDPAAIIVVTRSGFSALQVSKHRPKTRILSFSKDPRVSRRMHMYWGVKPLDVEWTDDRDDLIVRAVEKSLEMEYIYPNDLVGVVSGSTLIAPGQTTTLDILRVEDILLNRD